MKILLLNCPVSWAGIKRPVFPLGLAYIGTSLENLGHSVRLIDLNLYPHHEKKLNEVLQKNRFDYIGISLRNYFFREAHQINQWKKLFGAVKKISGSAKIVAGGPALSLLNSQVMNCIEEIDIGIIGRGEDTFLELIYRPLPEVKGIIYRERNALHATAPREEVNLDNLPIPKRDWYGLDLSGYDSLNLQTRRGCSFKCKYCEYKYLEGSIVRKRSIDFVEKEIEYLGSLGVRKIFFVDSVFNYPRDYSLEILDILGKYNLEWSAFFRANLLDGDYIKRLVKSKCKTVIISAESGSQAMLDFLDSDNSIKNIRDAISLSTLLTRNRVATVFTFIIGFPGEKIKDLGKTILFIIRALLNRCFVHVNVFFDPFETKVSQRCGNIKVNLGGNSFYRRCIYLFYPALILLDFIKIIRQACMKLNNRRRRR